MQVNKTVEKNFKYREILKQRRNLKGSYVKVGLPKKTGEKKHKNISLTLAEVLAFHEFGTRNVPRRPALRKSFDDNKKAWKKFTDKLLKAILLRWISASKALDLIGLKLKEDIQETIRKGVGEKNAPAVLKAKRKKGNGEEEPVQLIDSGQTITSISYEKVVK
ncbi:MAG: hypothetical protein GY817_04630 [bacterium]|nr:hypothetical protein [bacterium]